MSDQMVVFGQDGSMKYCGSYVQIADVSAVIERPVSRSISRQVASDFSETASQHLNTSKKSKEKVSITSASTGSTSESSTYSYYANSVGWRKGSIYVLFQAAHIITVSVPQVWLMWWTTAGSGTLAVFLPIYLSFSFLQLINQGVAISSILVWIVASTARRLHWVLLRTMIEARQAFFASTDLGEIINRFSQDLTLVEQGLPQAVMMTVGMFFMLCGQLALISLGSSYVAASLPCLFIAVYFVQSFYLRTSRQLRVLELEAKSPVYSHFMETLDGLTTIRAFGWLEESKAITVSRIEEAQTPYYLLLCIQRWLNLVLDLIVAALAVMVVALAVSLRSSTSAGRLGISLNNVLGTSTIISYLINAWTQLETSLGAVVRIKRFESDVVPEAHPHENHVPLQSWPQCGQVDIESVCATYNEGPFALKAITMRIESGQKIGIVGRTGSGKSSLVSALLRLLDLQTGSVIIDGVDISSVPRLLIRDRIIAVPQEVFLLTGSVRLNLDPDSL
jgi:ATP-binding cassette, subfamily C (CFTR/MRP), member 1